jgi:hypothetical protein
MALTRLNLLTLIVLFLCATSFAQEAQPSSDAPVFREPFTLKLRVDKKHYYEERYDKRIPYVANNDVYLFSGESFGLSLKVTGDEVTGLAYAADSKKADVFLTFREEHQADGTEMMLLIVQNKTKHRIYFDALMTRPDAKGIYKTSILPVEAGLSNYESWPHPIVQLVLRNIRFSEKPREAAQPQKN